jgi:hypothetical protein
MEVVRWRVEVVAIDGGWRATTLGVDRAESERVLAQHMIFVKLLLKKLEWFQTCSKLLSLNLLESRKQVGKRSRQSYTWYDTKNISPWRSSTFLFCNEFQYPYWWSWSTLSAWISSALPLWYCKISHSPVPSRFCKLRNRRPDTLTEIQPESNRRVIVWLPQHQL